MPEETLPAISIRLELESCLISPKNLSKRSNKLFLVALLLVLAFNAVVLIYFHNRFWWPPDEGVYAHIAERVLKGEALNSDVEEIHTGYLNLLHSAVFGVFGIRLVSLRYPLIAIAFLQSLLVFLILAKSNLPLAVMGAVGSTAMGVIQYLNPTPNWYCLFLATLIAFCLTYIPPRWEWRIVLIGCLSGLVFLFRQITGVFVGMAVLTYLLSEEKNQEEASGTLVSKSLVAVMLVGTVLYLASATFPAGMILFGIWPIALLAHAFAYSTTDNKRAMHIVISLAIGYVISALPILIYHVAHRSMWTFFDDTVFRALHVAKFSYLKLQSYWDQLKYALENVAALGSFTTVTNGLYWVILPLIASLTGVLSLVAFRQSRTSTAVGSIPFISVFYAQVALLQQIPIYLFYSLPLSFAGVLWLLRNNGRRTTLTLSLATLFLSFVSIYYQAGQPIGRTLGGIIRGERIALVPATTLPRTGLFIDPESLRIYTEVVQTIQGQTKPTDTIFVLPNDPEFYFLAERKNPFRFWNTAVGVRDDREAAAVMELLKREPPRIIVIDPRDRNNTEYSNAMIDQVRGTYSLIKTVSNFEIYRAPQ
jgi:hypothetical protein